jgi:hypothetical protein
MDLDRELATALTVDPSPEFVARVRAQIAHSPAPADRNLSMMLVATGSAMLVLVIVLALGRVGRNASASAPIEKPAAAPRSGTASVSAHGTLSRAGRVAKAGVIRRKDPDVLVPAHEAMALRELFAAVRDGRVDLTALVEDPSYTVVETDLRGETVIPPVSLELVQGMTNSEGARQ